MGLRGTCLRGAGYRSDNDQAFNPFPVGLNLIQVIVDLTCALFLSPMGVVVIGDAGICWIRYPAVELNPLQQVLGVCFDLSNIMMPFFSDCG
jgi:hypothetical protein